MAAQLAARAEREGRATVRGCLLDIGRYPGLLLQGEQEIVGELYRLDDARAGELLEVLDRYEGALDEPPLFRRVAAVARDSDGRAVEAWIYVWARPAEGFPIIRSGDWLAAG